MQTSDPIRVLVADDDSGIRDLVRSSLTQVGYQVDVAQNGRQALERLQSRKPDALILDISMPEMDGFGVLSALKRMGSTMPVLVMSARHSPDDVIRAIGLGAKDYLAKPYTNAQLHSRLARLFHRRPPPVKPNEITLDF